MIGLFIAIILFNTVALKIKKKLSRNLMIHIWTFTISLQILFDIFVDFKYNGYWYFTKEIDWISILDLILLVPPVNVIFLNFYPVHDKVSRKCWYFLYWSLFILFYEFIALLPEPWGYFHYGWWKWWYSALLNPLLLFILTRYHDYIFKVEKQIKTPSN